MENGWIQIKRNFSFFLSFLLYFGVGGQHLENHFCTPNQKATIRVSATMTVWLKERGYAFCLADYNIQNLS